MKQIPVKVPLVATTPPNQYVIYGVFKEEIEHREDGPDWIVHSSGKMTWRLYDKRYT